MPDSGAGTVFSTLAGCVSWLRAAGAGSAVTATALMEGLAGDSGALIVPGAACGWAASGAGLAGALAITGSVDSTSVFFPASTGGVTKSGSGKVTASGSARAAVSATACVAGAMAFEATAGGGTGDATGSGSGSGTGSGMASGIG